MKITITKTKDGRYFAQYIKPNDIMVSGIGQFGNSPEEAEINLRSLLINVRREQNKSIVNIQS